MPRLPHLKLAIHSKSSKTGSKLNLPLLITFINFIDIENLNLILNLNLDLNLTLNVNLNLNITFTSQFTLNLTATLVCT